MSENPTIGSGAVPLTRIFGHNRPQKLCGAKLRRNSTARCGRWAMANGRCRLHGGCSTGPRSNAGIERLRKARTKHGRYSLMIFKRKFLRRQIRLWQRRYEKPAPRFLIVDYWEKLKPMTWKEFEQERKRFNNDKRRRKIKTYTHKEQ